MPSSSCSQHSRVSGWRGLAGARESADGCWSPLWARGDSLYWCLLLYVSGFKNNKKNCWCICILKVLAGFWIGTCSARVSLQEKCAGTWGFVLLSPWGGNFATLMSGAGERRNRGRCSALFTLLRVSHRESQRFVFAVGGAHQVTGALNIIWRAPFSVAGVCRGGRWICGVTWEAPCLQSLTRPLVLLILRHNTRSHIRKCGFWSSCEVQNS